MQKPILNENFYFIIKFEFQRFLEKEYLFSIQFGWKFKFIQSFEYSHFDSFWCKKIGIFSKFLQEYKNLNFLFDLIEKTLPWLKSYFKNARELNILTVFFWIHFGWKFKFHDQFYSKNVEFTQKYFLKHSKIQILTIFIEKILIFFEFLQGYRNLNLFFYLFRKYWIDSKVFLKNIRKFNFAMVFFCLRINI